MKDIKVSQEVRAKIEAMFIELNDICVANNLPFVAATVLSKTLQTDGTVTCERVVSAYIDAEAGAIEPTILAASKVLSAELGKASIAGALFGALLASAAKENCGCEKCVARRAAEKQS